MYFCRPWVIFDSFVHQNFLVLWLFGGRGRNRRDTWTDRLFKGNILFDTGLYWIISSFSLQAHRRRNVIVLTKRCSRLQLSEKDNSYRWIYESERMENQLQRTIYIEEKIWFWNWMNFSKCRSNICPGVSAP